MVIESHIAYNQEVKEGDEVDVNLTYCNHDKKRLLYKFEMIHKEKNYLAATMEILALYVDLNERKVAEFEKDKIKIMNEFIEENKSNFDDKDLKFQHQTCQKLIRNKPHSYGHYNLSNLQLFFVL